MTGSRVWWVVVGEKAVEERVDLVRMAVLRLVSRSLDDGKLTTGQAGEFLAPCERDYLVVGSVNHEHRARQ